MSSKTAFKWIPLPLVTGIYSQGSIKNTTKTEWWLQPVGVVASRTGAQTKMMNIDSKMTRDIESPDLPGVMLLIFNAVTLSHSIMLLWFDRALKSVFHGLSLLKTAPIHLIPLVYYVTNGSSATHFAYIQQGMFSISSAHYPAILTGTNF